jgi:transposase InsO family protein
METSQEPTTYVLLRVTFGDKPSPDMASFVMLKMAKEHRQTAPEASKIIERDRYVDDLIHSCPSVSDAFQRITDVEKILSTGSFKIKEWHCSSDQLQERLSERSELAPNSKVVEPQRESPDANQVSLDGEPGVKTLGVSWKPNTDTINFDVKLNEKEPYTKRVILSNISRIFDPLGLASVVTIKARIALQEIWKMKKFEWDDLLPKEMQLTWRKLFTEIEDLKTVQFPRCLQPPSAFGFPELHIFADASILAYGAAAYLVWSSSSGRKVRLVSAKARVAPLRQTTIPRLELMAALLATRLAKTIYDEFKIKPSKVTLWSDSMIVLAWLRSESTLLKSFVGVRVAEIQVSWEPTVWRYVPTNLNPADDLSRGISVHEMNGRWMNGPSFLRKNSDEWPTEVEKASPEIPEVKVNKPLFALVQPAVKGFIIDASRFSSWQKLCRVTAYCLRFISNARSLRVCGPLLPEEIELAESYWIKSAQSKLEDWKDRYRDLAPYEKDGIIRVGGRLTQSPLSYDENHPMLLPADHVISKLVVKDSHNRVSHAGRERTLCEVRRRFWIVRGRNLVKKIVKDCVTCRKLRQYPYTTLMADLPPHRLKLFSPPFTATGVDLFGPFHLKYGRNKIIKSWGTVFTCATVRAIHLEIVQDLSTEAFLHALRRFAARHGWPTTISSDNGTSFIGAESELRKLMKEGRREIEDFAVTHKIKWRFNTPLSPHQGGMFERMVKQTKTALKVIVGQHILSWNEMSTVFAEVECLVNSRPLGYPSNDANDLQPLTPNRFILGRATADIPQGPFREAKAYRKRFEFVQSLVQQFWSRFQ